MKKLVCAISILVVSILLTGCKEKETPADRVQAYVTNWNESEFKKMYSNFLNTDTKKMFDADEFVDRQEKLAKDLGIKNLKVTYTKPKEETEWKEEEPAIFPIQITMDTIAGPIEFEKDLTWNYETHDDTDNWFADWDPSFILPNLTEKDKIQISTMPSKRGKIFDRNGNPLAVNGTGYEAGIVPGKFTDETKKSELAKLLNTSVDFIDKQLNQSWVQPDYFVPIAPVSKNNQALLDKLISIPGITYQATEMREYPYGESAAHLTGYIGKMTAELLEKHKEDGYKETDLIGRQGLERVLEERLRGKDGIGIYIKGPETGATLQKVIETEAVNGENITLTIDAELQKKIFTSMKGEPGASAAVDPQTGETLALVSSPSFDPAEFMLGVSGDRYKKLSEDPLKPLFNRFAAAYAPGSSLKPITAAIGLEKGTLKPDQGLSITGQTWQKDSSWGAYRVSRLHPEAPNPLNLKYALIYSDNIYFAQQALAIGKKDFIAGLTNFGFGEEIPFMLNISPSQISNDGTISSEGQLADTSFGQGQTLVNILHLATIYEPILTNGIMYKPTLLLDDKTQQVWKEGILSKDTADILKNDLRSVVVDGFAQAVNIPDIPISGKTGTAELKTSAEGRGQENGFFVSYNTNNPAFILAMMIENVEDNGGSGYVAEFASEVYKANHKK
ncbi:penicillin-binding transpeptidase domain-containing protein [Sporosarcina sp. BI001-red]|uniref:penicillin-binding transpeptidase domain-containing protein n=1 Tax=Sporosarcina sp. BI001-red TaxID=2282866 RepID=UPI000E24A5CC|nr:penicillin-binding transpeptidase domain-containing protein [Sporosarcina sp. BI001-red]REB07129.1 penicillin-binding transpeptidase domain-containing protein [Sporosarcina sp. BI001-red]